MRWGENFAAALHNIGVDVAVFDSKFENVRIKSGDEDISLEDYMKLNEGKFEFIRENVLMATRNFDQRLKIFIKTILMSKHNHLHFKHYNYRIEFQLREALKFVKLYMLTKMNLSETSAL